MEFTGLIDDDEIGKVELWKMKKETSEEWNKIRDGLMSELSPTPTPTLSMWE